MTRTITCRACRRPRKEWADRMCRKCCRPASPVQVLDAAAFRDRPTTRANVAAWLTANGINPDTTTRVEIYPTRARIFQTGRAPYDIQRRRAA